MKSERSNSKGKPKVKVGKLKIHKETIENLSDRDAAGVKLLDDQSGARHGVGQ